MLSGVKFRVVGYGVHIKESCKTDGHVIFSYVILRCNGVKMLTGNVVRFWNIMMLCYVFRCCTIQGYDVKVIRCWWLMLQNYAIMIL